MKIAGVVVLYNPSKEDILNIESYYQYLDYLYVIDNSPISNEGMLANYPNSEYHLFSENIGLASALNFACKKACDSEYEWILTMDQDSKFEGNFEEYLRIAFKDDLSNIALISPWHSTEYSVDKPKEELSDVNYVMTSGNLVNLVTLEKLGWFCDWLFIDGIDMEYCFRLKKYKYNILQINSIELNHSLGSASKHRFLNRDFETTNHSYIRRYYIARNMMYLKKMYYEMDHEFFDVNCNVSKMIFKIIMFEKQKIKKVYAILKGRKDYIVGKRGKVW